MSSIILAFLFFLVAIIYSSVGFGGGSSYTALLFLAGISFQNIAPLSLASNIVVVGTNSVNFQKAKLIDLKIFIPICILSIPMAYIGGRLEIEKQIFLWILFIALMLSGLSLLFNFKKYDDNDAAYKKPPSIVLVIIGAILGLVAGITGIGGGIFLSPILYILRAAQPKQIASTASLFILVNSVSGLIGQLQKHDFKSELFEYWYLPLIVFIGGQIGSRLAIKILKPSQLSFITAILIIFVAVQLGIKHLF